MNYDPLYLNKIPNTVTVSTKLNFKNGRTAHVAQTLLHESDILHAREHNQMNSKKAKQMKEKLEKAKNLTAMLNFKAFGCKIGEDSLKARLKMAKKKYESAERIIQKRNDILNKRKAQYIELVQKIKNENIPVEKLTLQQLKVLCMHKKRDADTVSISKLKRPGLLALLLEWQSRPDIDVSTMIPQGTSQSDIGCDLVVNENGDIINTMIVNDDNMDLMEL